MSGRFNLFCDSRLLCANIDSDGAEDRRRKGKQICTELRP